MENRFFISGSGLKAKVTLDELMEMLVISDLTNYEIRSLVNAKVNVTRKIDDVLTITKLPVRKHIRVGRSLSETLAMLVYARAVKKANRKAARDARILWNTELCWNDNDKWGSR